MDELTFEGAETAQPAPGVHRRHRAGSRGGDCPLQPSTLGVAHPGDPRYSRALVRSDRVIAVSPLFGGKALKGPADRVMASLGLAPGNQGVADAYPGLISDLIVDVGDAGETARHRRQRFIISTPASPSRPPPPASPTSCWSCRDLDLAAGGDSRDRAGRLRGSEILAACDRAGLTAEDGDVFVVTHKIVSKAEGRTARILTDTDYRALIADEAADIIRRRGDLVITRTRHGFICANAAVDRSNTPEGTAVLLPIDPDRSAHRIRVGLERATGKAIGVLITDTFGRAWRRGQTDVAIGMSGVMAVLDLRGTTDHEGRELAATEVAVADELAGAADLVMGKATKIPVASGAGFRTSRRGPDRRSGEGSERRPVPLEPQSARLRWAVGCGL